MQTGDVGRQYLAAATVGGVRRCRQSIADLRLEIYPERLPVVVISHESQPGNTMNEASEPLRTRVRLARQNCTHCS